MLFNSTYGTKIYDKASITLFSMGSPSEIKKKEPFPSRAQFFIRSDEHPDPIPNVCTLNLIDLFFFIKSITCCVSPT